MLLAIIPLLAWGIGAGFAVGGAIVTLCCKRNSSSSATGTTSQEGTASSGMKLRCLLAGYTDAGKSEFVCGLCDYLQHGERMTHAVDTITPDKRRVQGGVNGWSVEFVDGPGLIDGGQQDRYVDFLHDANRFSESRPHVVVFVVDLTTITKVLMKRKIKSEMEILNRCAVECREKNCSRKIHMVVVGSHADELDKSDFDLQRDFTGWMNEIISSDHFDPWYVSGDLYHDCAIATQFCEHIREVS